MSTSSRALDWRDHVLGALLGSVFVGILLATSEMGFARDEGFYFHAAYDYLQWFKVLASNLSQGDWSSSFSQEIIDRHWAYNQEHPVFIKALFSLSYWVFHEGLGWMRPSTAMRFPAMVLSGAMVHLVYLFGAEAFGRWQGVTAAVLTAAMPRPFFHAHMACFDYPVATMWFLMMYAWWKGLRSTGWAWFTGVCFGLGLSVKHNIFFLPPTLVIHWLLVHGARTRISRIEGSWRLQLPHLPAAFLSMAFVGPLVWYLLWPSHWFDTYNRIAWYFRFHLKHVHYYQYYFGENLYEPPFPVEFPFVLSLVTMPPVTMLAAFIGAGVLLIRWLCAEEGAPWLSGVREMCRGWFGFSAPEDKRGTGWWLLLGVMIPFLIIAAPNTPIFGGIKHWMPAMPFLALLSSVAIVGGGQNLAGFLKENGMIRQVVVGAVVLLCALPAILATWHSHPYGTAYYNELVGGTRGAADREMMRQFWGFASYHGLEDLAEHEEKNAQVFFHNTNHDSYLMYRREGSLRKDLRYGRLHQSSAALFHQQMVAEHLELKIQEEFKTMHPSFVESYDGVPLLKTYRRALPEDKKPVPPPKAKKNQKP